MIAANIQAYIEGEWFYHTAAKTLTHPFANDHELAEQGLIDAHGYLTETFKAEIREALGEAASGTTEGPFGDDDIFSGEVFDEEIRYNIELHNISEANMDALQTIPNVNITIIG